MLTLVKKMLGQHAGVKITVQSTVDHVGSIELRALIQRAGLNGFVDTLTLRGQTLIEVEGRRSDIEQLVQTLKTRRNIFTTSIFTLHWLPFEGRFSGVKLLV